MVTLAKARRRKSKPAKRDLAELRALERKVAWLSAWTIHHANHLRPVLDGLKVGGHQASSASVVTLLSALYFHVLRPEDRVAVKPHASPVFHAIQYLQGRQTCDHLQAFRGYGGAQSYPSRTKDADDVDFSTGSVGLGGAMALFASLVQDYILDHDLASGAHRPGRMVTVFGDAELDEGNVYEALLDGAKSGLRNCWWIIDYNRQSLDAITADRSFSRIAGLFEAMSWRVITLKYGKLLQAVEREPGGTALIEWIDRCPNDLYSALTFKGGAAWRERLLQDLEGDAEAAALIERHDDEDLHALMTNLAGHDLESVIEAFEAADDDRPTCFIAYTIKGHGLPLAGHKDNHAGLMNEAQMEQFRESMGVPEGKEWDRFAGLDVPPPTLEAYLAAVPFAQSDQRRHDPPQIPVPDRLFVSASGRSSTQEAFGRILRELGRGDTELAQRIVTTSPDVTVSTNLGGWVNQRQIYRHTSRSDVFHDESVVSPQRWTMSPQGQHIELGIAENNLFLLLAAAGLSHSLFDARLIPIGTLYDPFIARGLDALNYAAYQDARFILVATPSGISLAPEGGAHQSIGTPLVGIGQPGLAALEPGYVDELEVMLRWAFAYLQEPDGQSVYLRLSTRPVEQIERTVNHDLEQAIIDGGYWLRAPAPGTSLALVYSGAVATEVLDAYAELQPDMPEAGVLAVTSADRLHGAWRTAQAARRQGQQAQSHLEKLLDPLASTAGLVTVVDGHPATLSWLGSVRGHKTISLGVDEFGQSGDLASLYRSYGIDRDAILDAAAEALTGR